MQTSLTGRHTFASSLDLSLLVKHFRAAQYLYKNIKTLMFAENIRHYFKCFQHDAVNATFVLPTISRRRTEFAVCVVAVLFAVQYR